MTLRIDGTVCTCKSGLITGAMSAWYVRMFSCKDCKSIFGINCKVLVCMQPFSVQGLVLQYVSTSHSRLSHAAFAKDLCMPLQKEVQLPNFCTAVRSAHLDAAHDCQMAASLSVCRSCSPVVLKSVFVSQVFEKLGLSLYDFLRVNQYRPFRIDVVRDFGRQLLESVAYLHGLDLIHTDLKPENILLAACDDDRKSPTPGIRSAMLPPCFFFSRRLCALLLLLPLLLFLPSCIVHTNLPTEIADCLWQLETTAPP